MNLTDRNKQVLELARTAATRFGNPAISDVHLAIGLIEEGEGVAVTAMVFHGIAPDRVLEQLVELGETSASPSDANARMESAHAESTAIGHPYVGTEHLLLALLRNEDTPVARLFGEHGLTYEVAKARVLWILNADPLNPAPFSAPQSH